MNQNPRRVCLAKIATAHGVRGLVKLTVYAEDPHSIENYDSLFTSEAGSDSLQLKIVGQMNKYWLAELEGISDRTAAEKLRGTGLWVDRSTLPDPDEGQHYYTDLIDLPARDRTGAEVGKIAAVVNFGASDLLEISPPDGTSFYLPFVSEYVIEVNKDCIVVSIPSGLV